MPRSHTPKAPDSRVRRSTGFSGRSSRPGGTSSLRLTGPTLLEVRRAYYAGRVPYEWESWSLAALKGIEPHEVRHVLEDTPRRWPRPAVGPDGLEVLTIWGRTRAGRSLIVAVRHADGRTWKIIGAREMTASELAEFSRWEGTR